MICKFCGTQNEDSAAFCHQCGNSLTGKAMQDKGEVKIDIPDVAAYLEVITVRSEFCYTHIKQNAGHGQYGKVVGYIEPWDGGDYEFVNNAKLGAIPAKYVSSCDKGFKEAVKQGSLIGFPIVNIRCVINDGKYHPVDSSDTAFQLTAIGAFREAYDKASPCILEAVMKVAVEGPTEFHKDVFASINQRRGIISASSKDGAFFRIEAEVPLGEMSDYSTILHSLTRGKAEFLMKYEKHIKVPVDISQVLVNEYAKKRKHE